jgi:hypothetical protein
MQGIYTYIPEINNVSKQYIVAAILSLLFMVPIYYYYLNTFVYLNNIHSFHSFTYLLTYLLTPWSTVVPEKPTSLQLVNKIPAFYGTQMFITAFTNARYLSLSSPYHYILLPEDPS